MITSDSDDAGTNDTLNLKITDAEGKQLVDVEFGGTGASVGERPEQFGAKLYWLERPFGGPKFPPFSKGTLKADSIQLSIEGPYAWLPASFFLFGLDELIKPQEFRIGRPTVLVPLVHLVNWNLSTMSAGPSEGLQTVTLPLAPRAHRNARQVAYMLIIIGHVGSANSEDRSRWSGRRLDMDRDGRGYQTCRLILRWP